MGFKTFGFAARLVVRSAGGTGREKGTKTPWGLAPIRSRGVPPGRGPGRLAKLLPLAQFYFVGVLLFVD